MSYISPESDKSQQGGAIENDTLNLLTLLQKGDPNRVPTELFQGSEVQNQNTYYPSQSDNLLKGYVSAGDIQFPVFTAPMRFPFGVMDAKRSRIEQAAMAALKSAERFSIEPPKTWENYQDSLAFNWNNDVVKIIKDTQAKNPGGWFKDLQKPDSELNKKVAEYNELASKINVYKDRVQTIMDSWNKEGVAPIYLSNSIKPLVQQFYAESDKFFQGIDDNKGKIEKLNKMGKGIFSSSLNYTYLLNSLKKDMMSSVQGNAQIDPLNQYSVMQETKKMVTPETAAVQANAWLDMSYDTFVDVFNLPSDPTKLTNEERTKVVGKISEDIQKMMGVSSEWSQRSYIPKSDSDKANKIIDVTPVENRVFNITQNNYLPGTLPANATGSIPKENITFKKYWGFENNDKQVSVSPPYMYDLTDGVAVKPTSAIIGKVIGVGIADDPVNPQNPNMQYAIISAPIEENRTVQSWETGFEEFGKTSVVPGVSKVKERIIMVPYNSVSGSLGEIVNLKDFTK